MNSLLGLLAVLALVGVGVLIGALLVADATRKERERLRRWDDAVRARWDVLQAANRLDMAFWQARQRLRDDIRRHQSLRRQ